MVRSFRFRSTSVPAESYDFVCRAPDHLSKARAALSDLENLSHISRVHDNHFLCDANEHVHTSQLPPIRRRTFSKTPSYSREYSVPATYDDSYTRSETKRLSLAADTAVRQAQREVLRVQRELDIGSCDTTAPRRPRRYTVASPDIGHSFSYHSYHPEHTTTRHTTLPHQLHISHTTPHKPTYSPINLIRCLTDTHHDYFHYPRDYYHYPIDTHHHFSRPVLEDYHIKSTVSTPLQRSRSVHTSSPHTHYTRSYHTPVHHTTTRHTSTHHSPSYHTPTHHTSTYSTPTHPNSLYNYYYHSAPQHTTITPTYHTTSVTKHESSKHPDQDIQTLLDVLQEVPSIRDSSLSPSIHHSSIHHSSVTPSIHHTTTYPSLPPRPHTTTYPSLPPRPHTTKTTVVASPVQYYHTGLERPIEEHREVSETRKRVRDVLCKVKKNPHYFDI